MLVTRPAVVSLLVPLLLLCLGLVPAVLAQDPAKAAAAVPANMLIELQDVPTELTLPAPSKKNLFVTAAIRGKDVPVEVWLAREADAEQRVEIPAIGEGRYQLNLADDRVVLTLRRGGGSGQCYVFARTGDGRVAQSAAIRFETSGPVVGYDVEGGHGARRGEYHRADLVRTIVASISPSMPGVRVTAVAGDQTWSFEPREPDKVFTLTMTPEIVAAWEKAGGLSLTTSKSELVRPVTSTLRAIPRKLDIPPDGLTLHVPAETEGGSNEVPIPGANDYLYFRLSGVASDGGKALIALRRRDQSQNTTEQPLGHVETFQLADGQYAWTISAVQPAGRPQDAFVEVTILAGEAAEDRIVRRLIEYTVRGTCCGDVLRFGGNGYKAKEAAEQVLRLYESAAGGRRGVAALLGTIEAREREVGSQALFFPRGGDSDSVPLTKWLRNTIRAMGWEPIGDKPAPAPAPAARAPDAGAIPDVEPQS